MAKKKQEVEVLFEPFPKQIEFIEAVFSGLYDVILYGGAIRGGKTFAGLGTLILLCKKYPKSKWIVVRKSLQVLKLTTIPSFMKIVPDNFKKDYNQSTQKVTFTNGSEIMFFGENYDSDKELNRFRGLECNGFLIEECNELQEAAFEKCVERAGSWLIPGVPKKDQPQPLIMMTCNPSQNWVKKKFYNKWKDGELPNRWLYIQSKIFDNPFLTDAYKNSLTAMNPFDYQVFVNGDWDIVPKTGHEFYKSFDTEVHVDRVEYDPNLAIHLTLDFNVNPYISMQAWQIHKEGANYELRCIDEWALKTPDNNTESLAKAFRRDYPLHNAGLFYYGDPSGKARDTRTKGGGNDYTILHNTLKDYHPNDRVLRVAPKVVSRGNFINAIFRSEVPGISIVIDKNCYETIKDFINVKEDADGTKFKEKEKDPKTGITYEKLAHMSDATDYFICKAFERPYKKYVGKRRRLLS